ncbi:MAG: SRPBCC family protein [Acidobacteriota bacterium]
MPQFVRESLIQAPAQAVFDFHEAPDAFARLQPPWQTTKIVQPPASLAVGTRVVLRVKLGPFWQTMEAEHIGYEPGRSFTDRLVRGPFRRWVHQHIVEPEGDRACRLRDEIDYQLPLPPFGDLFGGLFARRELRRLFDFRHEVTRKACEAQERS